jgi:hypothetical protein
MHPGRPSLARLRHTLARSFKNLKFNKIDQDYRL